MLAHLETEIEIDERDLVPIGLVTEPAPAADLSFEADQDHWQFAACNDLNGTLTRVFFSDDLGDIAQAKRICATCPVIETCLTGALERREPWGVWGGQLFLNGKILASKRRRGRPPKVARPEDTLPEVPVPEALRELVELRTA